MKIAILVSGNRVSTVFDAADELLLIETGPGNAQQRLKAVWVGENAVGRTARIREMKVHILICGAMSAAVERMLEAASIRVISFVRGTVNEVLDAFHNGRLEEGRFFLPGCAPCGVPVKLRRRKRVRQNKLPDDNKETHQSYNH